MFTVGLTGMSGAGKSYVAARFAENGFSIIDADVVYHELVSGESDCMREIESVFGSGVVNHDGSLNRPALASVVFLDHSKLEMLNRITHKYVLEKIRNEIVLCKSIPIVDAPQLFESGFNDECDLIIGVIADRKVCVSRIVERDGITPQKALIRLDNQHDASYFKNNCDVVIVNNGNDISTDIENTIKLIKEKSNV